MSAFRQKPPASDLRARARAAWWSAKGRGETSGCSLSRPGLRPLHVHAEPASGVGKRGPPSWPKCVRGRTAAGSGMMICCDLHSGAGGGASAGTQGKPVEALRSIGHEQAERDAREQEAPERPERYRHGQTSRRWPCTSRAGPQDPGGGAGRGSSGPDRQRGDFEAHCRPAELTAVGLRGGVESSRPQGARALAAHHSRRPRVSARPPFRARLRRAGRRRREPACRTGGRDSLRRGGRWPGRAWAAARR